MCPHVGPHMCPSTDHQLVSTCNYPIYTGLDHLELFCWDRTGITNMLKGSLFYFNEGASQTVYLPILGLLLVILNGFNAWKLWMGYQHPHILIPFSTP